MKLIHCHIENFGKLNQQDIFFSDGYNQFIYDNGWGKSTLASFFKVMLYGFSGERSRDDIVNERKRFKPWQGGVYGGSLTFETGGKTYTVTRTFGMKEKEDTFSLREEETNLLSQDYTQNLGEELFQIDCHSFERTVMVSQNDCETNTTDRIHAKLGNLTDVTDDMNQYDKAAERMNDYLNMHSPYRKTGSAFRMREQMTALEAELRMEEKIEGQLENLQGEIQRIREEYNDAKRRQTELTAARKRTSEVADIQLQKERYRHLTKTLKERSEAEERYRAQFPQTIPKAAEIDRQISICIELAAEENRMNIFSLSDEEQKKLVKLEKIFRDETPGNHLENSVANSEKKTDVWIGIFIAAGILFISIGGVFYQKPVYGSLLFGTGVLLAAAGLFLYQRKAISKKYEAVRMENEQHEMKQNFIEYERLKNKNTLYEEAQNKFFMLNERVCSFISQLGFEPKKNLQKQLIDIKFYLDDYQDARKEKERAMKEREDFIKNHNMESIVQLDPVQEPGVLARIDKQMEIVQKNLESCHMNLIESEQKLQELFLKREEYHEKEARLFEMKDTYNRELKEYERVRLAKEYLLKAKSSFSAKYRNPLLKSFGTYYGMISGEKEPIYHLDADLELTMEELGMQRETRFFSTGWKDLMGICMRMAFVESMYREEVPFLILDDPFVNLDQEKTEAGLALLKEISNKYQVIYFTCHESRTI